MVWRTRRLPDLDAECTACVGVGLVMPPGWVVYYTGRTEAPPASPEEIACVRCDGTGLVPTPAGEELLAAHAGRVTDAEVAEAGSALRAVA